MSQNFPSCWAAVFTVCLGLLLGSGAQCAPQMLFPDAGPWGVVVHTPFHDGLKQIGVQWIRTDFRWSEIEKTQRGQYDWSYPDKLIQFYPDQGFHLMIVLNVEAMPQIYEADRGNPDVIIQAIAHWTAAAAKRYAGKVSLWEIGNEPEVFPMGGYWNNASTYTRMARQVARGLKANDPQGKVGAISMAWFDPGFMNTALKEGLLSDGTIDAITYHGYHRENMLPESRLAQDVAAMRAAIAKAAPQGKFITILDSERGYAIVPFLQSKHWGNWRNEVYSESTQAAYLARHYLETIYLGVETAIWYKDMNGENNFSLYYQDEKSGLRPSGNVYRNLAALLPENPLKLHNDAYTVSLVGDQQQTQGVWVRSYLQQNATGTRLIVALWNPVEAFDGKILDNRKQIGDYFYEAWRAVSEKDVVEVPAQVRIAGPDAVQAKAMSIYDLTAADTAKAMTKATFEVKDGTAISQSLKIGPMPTVLVFDL